MSETKQPSWEFVTNLGDVNVADFGGFIVYRDTTGVYGPEAEVYEPDDDNGETGGTMYRFVLEPPRFNTCGHNGGPCPGYPNSCPTPVLHDEWWVRKLGDVSEFAGGTLAELQADLESMDPATRARGYKDLVGYFGAHEFDHYPQRLTEEEAQARYKGIK